ncbi:hypothetical protein [Mycetocola tolaasinivorans]|uniref:hypothetical protein n=1 Tax=Mycetocola tolaasinivorans TaxID=76635 RepID=UPI0016042DEF|nr:hypothetical protein [Mycetocola tolaasinivorans]
MASIITLFCYRAGESWQWHLVLEVNTMDPKRRLIYGVFLVWLVATLFSQHPDDNNARVRRLVMRLGSFWIPNWKFFAPNPGVEDHVVFYRTGTSESDEWKHWQRLFPVEKVRFWEMFYSPSSRRQKGILDIVTTMQMLRDSELLRPQYTAHVSLLTECVRENMKFTEDPDFQVMVARGSGFEESIRPKNDFVFEPNQVQPVVGRTLR